MASNEIVIPFTGMSLSGELELPAGASRLVVFAHGSGSSRHSPRNQFVARILRQAGVGTLLFDLLTAQEEEMEARTRHLRFDIPLLADRLVGATRWLLQGPTTSNIQIGYFGSSTGAAAALVAAAEMSGAVQAIVSRGGRPDLAGEALDRVTAPTLLIVGGEDTQVVALNEEAYGRLQSRKDIWIVPGASHLFEEPGALEKVAGMAADWFVQHLGCKR